MNPLFSALLPRMKSICSLAAALSPLLANRKAAFAACLTDPHCWMNHIPPGVLLPLFIVVLN